MDPGFSQLKFVPLAPEQRGADELFQAVDLPAYRGLNRVQALSSARDIHLLGNGDEEAKIAEIHGDP